MARLFASAVDGLVLLTLFACFLLIAQVIAGPGPAGPGSGMLDRALAARGALLPGLALLVALSFVYSSLFHTLGGRTLGKRLLGLIVLGRNGKPPSLAVSATRSALALITGVPLLGLTLVFFTRNRQALHDKLTHTYVVRLLAGAPNHGSGGP
jgi:uncharacterized RDD family membrane protein YckC